MTKYKCPICNRELKFNFIQRYHNEYSDIYFICDNCKWQSNIIESETNLGIAKENLIREHNLDIFIKYVAETFKPLKVELRYHNNLLGVIEATRTSHDSLDKMDSYIDEYSEFHLGEKDKKLLKYVIDRGETSVLEHFIIQFVIEIPRFLLQEFARHRIGVSLTVKSTRYTLKELFQTRAIALSQFLYRDENDMTNEISLRTLENIVVKFRQDFFDKKVTIDTIKKSIPETYMTRMFVTFNGRALRHMFILRAHKSAHPDFRKLMKLIYDAMPKTYRDILLYGLDLRFD